MSKRLLMIVSIMGLFIAGSFAAYTAPLEQPLVKDQQRPVGREVAWNALQRSGKLVIVAQRAAKKGGQFEGLAKAIAHHRQARIMYTKGMYRESIQHSLRVRRLAIEIIRRNKGKVNEQTGPNQQERELVKSTPDDKELDQQVESEQPKSDQEAVDEVIELDDEK